MVATVVASSPSRQLVRRRSESVGDVALTCNDLDHGPAEVFHREIAAIQVEALEQTAAGQLALARSAHIVDEVR
jgi:hypothetical protein